MLYYDIPCRWCYFQDLLRSPLTVHTARDRITRSTTTTRYHRVGGHTTAGPSRSWVIAGRRQTSTPPCRPSTATTACLREHPPHTACWTGHTPVWTWNQAYRRLLWPDTQVHSDANTQHPPSAGSMLGQRRRCRRRWPNIDPTLGRCHIFILCDTMLTQWIYYARRASQTLLQHLANTELPYGVCWTI